MKYPLSFVNLHNPLFMYGCNLGDKISALKTGAELLLDTEEGVVWITYKGNKSGIAFPNVSSFDLVSTHAVTALPATQKKVKKAAAAEELEIPEGMTLEQAKHRAQVRAASMNSNKTESLKVQNDLLIQQSRAKAMGMKASAQVSNPTQPAQGLTGLEGKTKIMSHAQLSAQVAKEAKDVKGTA